MTKDLVVVESPAKAKTISRYLGGKYRVLASMGHVRDLPAKRLAVDVEARFKPEYVVSPQKKAILAKIRAAAKASERVYLATDPDREGEAIAWHVAKAARIDPKRCLRVSFDQVTKAAVQAAIAHPRQVDMALVDAQQARRVLDRLVGYKVSPLLSKSLHKRLSAGRVQSVALRLVVEREREIDAFVPKEYWSLEARFQRREEQQESFVARLHRVCGKEPELSSHQIVEEIQAQLQDVEHRVSRVKQGHRSKKPRPPFVTSTLQTAASGLLHMSPRQVMRVAQQLYEGIDIDGERVGLITYMRTDSTHVASEAQKEARELILERWGQAYCPARAPQYATRAKNAQEAHEAIRPTSAMRTPERLSEYLDKNQLRLYELIWRRFLASQMASAKYDTTVVDIQSGPDYEFRANASKLAFPGFLVVHQTEADLAEKDSELPSLVSGELIDLLELLPEQHFTQPPPRYSEATLIKELESRGIGRPSTFASIVTVIQDRKYVAKEKSKLLPTETGLLVCDILSQAFPRIMDYGYTAAMEQQLDQVAAGEQSYVEMLHEFWGPFSQKLEAIDDDLVEYVHAGLSSRQGAETEVVQECPLCGKPLRRGLSVRGPFLGCTGYPECRYILDLSDPSAPREVKGEYASDEQCERCGGRMRIISRGKQQFLGCENYPKCRNTKPLGGYSQDLLAAAKSTPCPACGHQPLQPRSGRYGEYLHCSSCGKNASLKKLMNTAKPSKRVDLACPHCNHQSLEYREGRYGPYYHCPACGKNMSQKAMKRADDNAS